MFIHPRVRIVALVCAMAICLVLGPSAHGHGGVVLEEDLCLIKIGFYEAHFTIYQPGNSGHEQFCEDLPNVGESVFVLEYGHDGLADLPMDFRIVRNVTDMGLFAGAEDLARIGNLDDITVFYQPPLVDPDVVTVMHQFDEPGAFIGVVTAKAPAGGVEYTAVFPFEVGFVGVNYPSLAFASVFLVAFVFVWLAIRRRRNFAAACVLAGTLGLFAPHESRGDVMGPYLSQQQRFSVQVHSDPPVLAINRMHRWRLAITDAAGQPVERASIEVTGGMPEHDHGLPTAPRVTRQLGDGVYLLEGVKFHMRGGWEIVLQISAPQGSDSVAIEFQL